MSHSLTALRKTKTDLRILVVGDVNIDTLLVPIRANKQLQAVDRMAWQKEGNWWRHRVPGGALLLKTIINAALASNSFRVLGDRIAESYDEITRALPAKNGNAWDTTPTLTSAAIVGRYPRDLTAAAADKPHTYRVERILGWVHDSPNRVADAGSKDAYATTLKELLTPHTRANQDGSDILVVHDNANYFRRLPPDLLEALLRQQFKAGKTWIVWHMYSPLAEGNLWNIISRNKRWMARTIAVVKMECLRQAGVHLPQATSLEQETRSFVDGLTRVPRVKELAQVRHLIVHQHREGVLHYDSAEGMRTTCYYCPYAPANASTGESGIMVGYTSVLVAAIVRGLVWTLLCRKDAHLGIIAAVKQGAVLDHLHYLKGFGDDALLSRPQLSAPYEDLFQMLSSALSEKDQQSRRRYLVTALPIPRSLKALRQWNRIDGFIHQKFVCNEDGCTNLEDQAEHVAFSIVRRGLPATVEEDDVPNHRPPSVTDEPPDTPQEAIRCPFEQHGKIKTAHGAEIDSFANIRRVMAKYFDDGSWTSPLSIAVFGPPGSGKSFTIRQILESIDPELAKRPLEYNLAQFRKPQELKLAFHKVQDEALAGEVPLVFFDEFDAGNFVWLKHFLAPMQDGKFKVGESTYRIGRAIFVFAGGVYESWSRFSNACKSKKFKARKAPDFVSRLRGYLDIFSINPSARVGGRHGNAISGVLMFRRAIVLRALLEKHMSTIFDRTSQVASIDSSILRAFLRIPRYAHETRSMEAIIEMSSLSSRGTFQRSSLPAAAQLNMHVDATQFYRLMDSARRPT
jgi:hypothetical protein